MSDVGPLHSLSQKLRSLKLTEAEAAVLNTILARSEDGAETEGFSMMPSLLGKESLSPDRLRRAAGVNGVFCDDQPTLICFLNALDR